MTEKMTLLYIEAVGQVAAALTRRSGPPDGDEAAADLVGEALAVRSKPDEAEFTIPASELAVASVDLEEAVLLEPRQYGVVDGAPVRLTRKVTGIQSPATNGIEVTVDIKPADLVPPAMAPVTLWTIFVDGATAPPVVATGSIAVDEESGFVTPALDPGEYAVLAMAAGYLLMAGGVTVP